MPRVLRRSGEGRFLLGICAGLGRHTGIDPVVFRVGFAVLLFGSGIGLFLYIAAFLLMKEPNGRPGYIEQWTRRDFDGETVLALLTAVLGFGLAINLTAVWLDTGTLVVGLLLAVSLLAAHSSGVDLMGLVRSMPERLNRRQAPQAYPPPPVSSPYGAPPPGFGLGPTAPGRPVATAYVPSRPAEPEPAPRPASRPEPRPEPVTAAFHEAPTAPPPPQAPPSTDAGGPPGDAQDAGGPPSDTQDAGSFPGDAQDAGDTADTAPVRDEPRAETGETREARAETPAVTERYGAEPRHDQWHALHGEPFAPRGPYQPLDPQRRAGHSPYDPALYGRPVPRRKRPRSFIGVITMSLAIVIGGIVVAVQARSGMGVNPVLVGGAVLVTIGAGLLVAAWWGRGAGLVAAGTGVALVMSLGLMVGGLPRHVGTADWTPLTAMEAGSRPYDVGVGDGRLDLSEIPLPPGADLTVDASVRIGELTVIVPPTARVEVHASNKVGDIQIDQSLRGGVDVRFDKVLEPETRPAGKAPTIVLNLRGGVGDMEVRRAA